MFRLPERRGLCVVVSKGVRETREWRCKGHSWGFFFRVSDYSASTKDLRLELPLLVGISQTPQLPSILHQVPSIKAYKGFIEGSWQQIGFRASGF